MSKSQLSPLQRAIVEIGSQGKVGAIVGATQQWVSDVANSNRPVPAEWCLPLENATRGKITRQQLRPDLYPPSEYAQKVRALKRAGAET